MFKVLFWLLFDGFFIYGFARWWDELGYYNILFILIILWFSWELVMAIKNLIGK